MPNFIIVPPAILKSIASGAENIPTIYYHQFVPVQKLSWLRLITIANLAKGLSGTVLDFGGGGGVFLPTLAKLFKKVICIDLCIDEAKKIKDIYMLKNVEIIKCDALKINFPNNYFDVVIAADVLEHFQNVRQPIVMIHNWLKLGGHLFVSGPSENSLYQFGRKIFKMQKPKDHYHSIKEIEQELFHYFHIQKKIFLPWKINLPIIEPFSIFTIIEAVK